MFGDLLGVRHVERRATDLARIKPRLQIGVDDEVAASPIQIRTPSLHLARAGIEPPWCRACSARAVMSPPSVDVVRATRPSRRAAPYTRPRRTGRTRSRACRTPVRARDELPDLPKPRIPASSRQLDAGEPRAVRGPPGQRGVRLRDVRASASSSAIVCSAAVITLDCGASATMIRRLVAIRHRRCPPRPRPGPPLGAGQPSRSVARRAWSRTRRTPS